MNDRPPDVLVIGAEWPERALIRAQLIEAGYDAVAIDGWPPPRAYRRPGLKPRAMIIDLQGLPDPRTVLEDVPLLLPPGRVLVITALGTLDADDIRQQGFNVLRRPVSIGDVVNQVSRVLHDVTGP